MTTPFRVLYRQFLFRVADLELLAPQGDLSKLLGQFASLLIFAGLILSTRVLALEGTPQHLILARAWAAEHALIAVTMLTVGLFAVLSWDSAFPDRLDVFVLGPLPVRPETVLLAKAAASATALGLTVAALNAASGLVLPFALAPDSRNLLELLLSPERYRLLAAYWITVAAAGAWIYGALLLVQGAGSLLLPRRLYLRLSAAAQIAVFCLLVAVYFLQPSIATPEALALDHNRRTALLLPSYWFLAMFQHVNGSLPASMEPLAFRAWTAFAATLVATAALYAIACRRTMKRIAEQPDIAAARRSLLRAPAGSIRTAILLFSARTLARSRRHRVMLAFYLGAGFAVATLFLGTPHARRSLAPADSRLLFSSLVMTLAAAAGVRVVAAVPIDVRSNWIFRLARVRPSADYLPAVRLALFGLGAIPVWLLQAAGFLYLWPFPFAARHLAVLALLAAIVTWLGLAGFRKIPFACSWLPGRSGVHMAALAALAVLFALVQLARYEQHALGDPPSFARLIAFLAASAVAARWIAARGSGGEILFDEEPDTLVTLGLSR